MRLTPTTIIVSVLLVTFSYVHVTGAATDTLATTANAMAPGTWAEVPQTNINAVLGRGAHTGNQLPYANAAAWDPSRRLLEFSGNDHTGGVNDATNYMYYSEDTNQWSFVGPIPQDVSPHGYDHNTIDPATGILYLRQVGLGSDGNQIWAHTPDGSWSLRTTWPVTAYINVADGTAWWTGSITGGSANGTLLIYNCGAPNGQVLLWDPNSNGWFADIQGFGGNSTYHCVAEYSPVHNVAIFGGGNDNPRKVWRLNSNGTVTALPDAPVGLGVQQANLTVDPVTGHFLVMGYGQLWELDPRGPGSWTQQSGSRIPPSAVGNPGSPNLDSVISAPISNYGVVTYVTCRAASCNMYLYKHSGSAQIDTTPPTVTITAPLDGANGNQTTSSTVMVAVNNGPDTTPPSVPTGLAAPPLSSSRMTTPSGGSSSSDFASRCAAPGVIKCVGFDQASDIAGGYGNNSGTYASDNPAYNPMLDAAVKASGNSSLKFTIPSQIGTNAGSYFTNFSQDLSAQFGENSEFYVQWRQRFSTEFVTTLYNGSEGWKQSIIGTGDQPSQIYNSCTALEIVSQNTYLRGFPGMYNSCTGSTSHGPYNPFEEPYGSYDFKLQNAMPSPYCLYSQNYNLGIPKVPPGGCFTYSPNEWMTFQVHVKMGPRVNDEFTNSFVQLWMAREGQPSQLVMNWGPYNLSAGAPAENQRYGKVWLLPYQTNKDPNQITPIAYTWYDELIISQSKIADPMPSTSQSGESSPAPMVTNVASSNVTTTSVTPPSLVVSTVSVSNVASSGTASDSQDSLTSGLIGYWNFEEGAGSSTYDHSGMGNSGILVNSPIWTSGKVGNALTFNATDNGNDNDDPRVLIGRKFDVAQLPFTVTAWVNPRSFADWRAIFSKRDQYSAAGMRFDVGLAQNSGHVYVTTGQDSIIFDYALQTNMWTHISVVADTTDTKLYVNGELSQTLKPIRLGTSAAANTVIGGTGEGPGGDNDPFNGTLDEVRIYNRVLTITEIQKAYSITTPPL